MKNKTKVCSALVLGMIGSMLGACGADSGDLSSASAKPEKRVKSVPSCPIWTSGGTYTEGEVVLYNSALYTALINQTDYAGTGWNPTVPTLFSPGGSCGATPPPFGGPGSPIPTPVPTPLPTPTPVAGCPPAWNSTTAYTAGQVVIDGGMVFEANWWTEDNEPTLNYGPSGSGEPWSWTGTYCGGGASGPIPTPVPPPSPAPTPTPTPA